MSEIKSWDDVTIGMYQELSQIQSESEVTKEIEQISILTDSDPEQIRAMSLPEFGKWRRAITFVNESPTKEVKIKFDIDGKKYGMIPQMDFISTGEWADADSWSHKPIENIHLYAAMLFRPITKDEGDYYEIEPHKSQGFLERASLFRDRLSINVIHGSVLFFSTFAIKPIQIIQDYLIEEQQTQSLTKKKQIQTLTKKPKQKRSKKTGGSTT